MGKYSPEALANYRRIRLARKLYKEMPTIAFCEFIKAYPGRTYEEFAADLVFKKPFRKKREHERKRNKPTAAEPEQILYQEPVHQRQLQLF